MIIEGIALVVAILSLLVALFVALYSRRNTIAAERSAAHARGARIAATVPQFELEAEEHATYGPTIVLRLISSDLDVVQIEVVADRYADDQPGFGLAPYIGGGGGRDAGSLGAMRSGETRRLSVSRSGRVGGRTIRLRCECRLGDDQWIVSLADTFPGRLQVW